MFVLFWSYRFSLIWKKLFHQSKMIVFRSPVLRMSQRSWDIGAIWGQIEWFQRPIERRCSSHGSWTTLFFQSLLSFQGNLKYTLESFFRKNSSYLIHTCDSYIMSHMWVYKIWNLSCHNTLSTFDQFATWTNAVFIWACPLVTLW